MQIHFKKIIISNFFSFDKEEINLEDAGCAIVTGKNNRKLDNALSNGSGKSTIFNAICYALTGETAQGVSNNIENIYANPDDCWVELHFSVDDDNFVVRRIKTPRSDMKIYINGVDASGKGIKESNKLLSDYIPDLSSRFIGSVIILGQGMPYRFTNYSPSGRKGLLEELTKSDFMIQSIKDKLHARFDELSLQLRSYEDKNIANETQLNIYTNQLNTLRSDLDEFERENIDSRLADIELIKKDCISHMELNKKELDELNNKLENLNNEFAAKLSMLDADYESESLGLNISISEISADYADAKSEAKSLEKEITRLDKIIDTCPTCGQKIPNAKKVDTTDLKDKLKILNDKIAEIESVKSDAVSKLTSLNTSYKKSKSDVSEELSSKKEVYTKAINDVNISITRGNDDLSKLIQEEIKLKSLKDNHDKTLNQWEDAFNKIKDLKTVKEDIDMNLFAISEHISIVQNLITLAKREFRGVLLSNIIKCVNDKVKSYSIEVFGSDLLSFELNENNIDIKFDGKYYEAMSGGEKQKIDIIIQLALRDLLSNQFNFHTNIVVLDEVFDGLDAAGCQKVIDLISKLNDAESIFIISHHVNELQIAYDNEIIVEKNDSGVSTVRLG